MQDATAFVAADHSQPAVVFDNVTFRYPESAHKTEAEKLIAQELGASAVESLSTGEIRAIPDAHRAVLDSVSFTIASGSKTAIVGPSGAGKSSILSLMERFYDPQRGTIRVFGHDSTQIDRQALRNFFGYVEQDAPILAGSIRDNLLIGSPAASDAELEAVLGEVNLLDILARDPEGLDAPVGEGGVLLSGGERQRLAIARALLQAPDILLLDESTSSLDGPNELLMKEAIDKVSVDRTLVVIAHRLATVVDSDQIVVLKQGMVEAIGTHEQLLESSTLYKNLAEHQLLV